MIKGTVEVTMLPIQVKKEMSDSQRFLLHIYLNNNEKTSILLKHNSMDQPSSTLLRFKGYKYIYCCELNMSFF